MGSKALVIVKVYPEGVEEASRVEASLKGIKTGMVRDVKKEPLAFGLSVFRVGIEVNDQQEGITDAIEKELKGLDGVKEIEIEGVTLI